YPGWRCDPQPDVLTISVEFQA
ncbi:uncharacterized protein METZ01_LOCUS254584, partial [marine metagenome]